MFHAW